MRPTILGGNDSLIGPTEGIHVDKNGTICVSSFGSNDVAIFPAGSYGDAIPARFIQGGLTGLSGATGMTTDASLDLWVANSGGSIVEFAPNASGNAAPIGIIPANATTTLSAPESVAFDSNGRLVVGDYGDGKIKIFAAGATGSVAPVQVINSGFGSLTVGLDASNKFYVIGTSCEHPQRLRRKRDRERDAAQRNQRRKHADQRRLVPQSLLEALSRRAELRDPALKVGDRRLQLRVV